MTLVSTPILRPIVFEARLALKPTVCNQINQSNPLWENLLYWHTGVSETTNAIAMLYLWVYSSVCVTR